MFIFIKNIIDEIDDWYVNKVKNFMRGTIYFFRRQLPELILESLYGRQYSDQWAERWVEKEFARRGIKRYRDYQR